MTRSVNVRAALAGLAGLGLDVAAICEAAGIPPTIHTDPDLLVSNDCVLRMWKEATDRDARPHLALHVGRAVPFGAYEVIDYLAASSRTIGEGFVEMARYFALVTAGLSFGIDVSGSEATVALSAEPTLEAVSPIGVEYTWAVVVCRFRESGNAAFQPLELSVPYEPADPAAFAFLADRLVVRRGESVLRVPRRMWDLPHDRQDARLREVLERHARLLVSQLPAASPGVLDGLRQAIHAELRAGNPGIDTVAPRLGMSPRTLQRRLKEEGLVYQDVVDEVRESLARGYLRSSRLSVAEVAYLVGYSEPSAFNRAFKRWTGMTPNRFRAGP